MSRTGMWIGLVIGVFLLLGLLLPYGAGLWLLFGWVVFPFRVLPEVSVYWPSVALGCTTLVLFTAGVQWMGRAWARRAPQEEGWLASRWRLRWSLALVAVVFLLFVGGVAMVAVTHQALWLASAPEPRTGPTFRAPPSSYNLKSLAIAVHNHQGAKDDFPLGGSFRKNGTMLHSWETALLPYLGYSRQGIAWELPWNHPKNAPHFKGVVPQFVNSGFRTADLQDAEGFGLSHYAVNSRIFSANSSLGLAGITDSRSTTLLIGEVNANFKPWGHPVNWRDPARGINRSPHGFGGPPGAGGANFAMADGSGRFVSDRISPQVLEALATPRGGEDIDEGVLGDPGRW